MRWCRVTCWQPYRDFGPSSGGQAVHVVREARLRPEAPGTAVAEAPASRGHHLRSPRRATPLCWVLSTHAQGPALQN